MCLVLEFQLIHQGEDRHIDEDVTYTIQTEPIKNLLKMIERYMDLRVIRNGMEDGG